MSNITLNPYFNLNDFNTILISYYLNIKYINISDLYYRKSLGFIVIKTAVKIMSVTQQLLEFGQLF